MQLLCLGERRLTDDSHRHNLLAHLFLTLLLLLAIPVPGLTKLLSRGVMFAQRLKIGPVPVIFAVPAVLAAVALKSYLSYNERFGGIEPDFTKESFKFEHRMKRAMAERNLYIHILSAVLGFAIIKITALALQLDDERKGAAEEADKAAADDKVVTEETEEAEAAAGGEGDAAAASDNDSDHEHHAAKRRRRGGNDDEEE